MGKKPDLEIIMRYLQWWDPLHIIDDLVANGNLLDEYDDYAKEIHVLLESKAGLFKLMAKLEEIQKGMAKEGHKDRDRILAEGLISCYESHEELFY
jgi:hypothetical protein